MPWEVSLHDDFLPEFNELPAEVRVEIGSLVRLLQHQGPQLERPHCGTLKGSAHTNLKELRFNLGREQWRVAFAFDLKREAILLVAGAKGGINKELFYSRLIGIADARFTSHQDKLQPARRNSRRARSGRKV